MATRASLSLDCGPQFWDKIKSDMEEIAKTVGGKLLVTNDQGNLIVNNTKSHNEIIGMFDTLEWPDLHWDHWNRVDRKVWWNDRWYHLSVGHGYGTEQRYVGSGDRRDLRSIDVIDDTKPPLDMQINCKTHAPGSVGHFLKDFLRPKLKWPPWY